MAKQQAQYRRYTRTRFGNVIYFSFLVLAGLFTVVPLFYCIITSFKPLDELLVFPPRFFVVRPTFDNYRILPSLLGKLRVPISRYIFNSIFVAVISTFLHIVVASLAAFALSKSNEVQNILLYKCNQIL